jgi:hypothetical protein
METYINWFYSTSSLNRVIVRMAVIGCWVFLYYSAWQNNGWWGIGVIAAFDILVSLIEREIIARM